MEFKDHLAIKASHLGWCINRIRLEFKGGLSNFGYVQTKSVLIESDWNLKLNPHVELLDDEVVLIESDWNLKTIVDSSISLGEFGINRIRLEFKGYWC